MPAKVKMGGGKVELPSNNEVEEFYALRALVQQARPKPFIERYFKIRDLRNHNVPMLLTEDQNSYYDQSFLTLPSYETPAHWLVWKAREAYSTTYWTACATAFQVCVPGFPGDLVIDSDKNLFKSLLPLHTHFIDNLPPWMGIQRGFWDKDVREIIHNEVGVVGGALHVLGSNTSVLTFSSARSKNFGRGGRPKMIVLSEAGAYDQTFAEDLELSLADSLTDYSWRIDESTPRGGTVFHRTFKAIRDKAIPGVNIKRYWFQKSNTAFSPTHILAREQDRTPFLIMTPEEKSIVQRFPPTDKTPPSDRIRWRRARVAAITVSTYGDVEKAT